MRELRNSLKAIYKGLTILITACLMAGAVLAYWHATPANGLLLVAGILAVLALIAGLSIHKLEWRDEQAEILRSIVDDLRSNVRHEIRTGIDEDLREGVRGDMGSGIRVTHSFADPEVHRVDAAMLDTAKQMASDGAPIDDICRAVDPGHDSHDPVHQEAFRRIVRAMIEQA